MTLSEPPLHPHGPEESRQCTTDPESWLRARLDKADAGLADLDALRLRAGIAVGEAWLAGKLKDDVPSGLIERIKRRTDLGAARIRTRAGSLVPGVEGSQRMPRRWHLVLWSGGVLAAAAAIGLWFNLGTPAIDAEWIDSGIAAYETVMAQADGDAFENEAASLWEAMASLELAMRRSDPEIADDQPGADLLHVLDEWANDADGGLGRSSWDLRT